MTLALTLACLTCKGAEPVRLIGPPPNPGTGGGPAQAAFSVTLNVTAATISVGSTTTLVATVRDSLGVVLAGVSVTWSSGNAGVASVSSSGVVTGISPGSVSIGASFGGVTATANVTVATVPVASVLVVPATATQQLGTTIQLTAVPQDANGLALTGRSVAWSSNNAAVASVDNTGLVSALAVGTATITAVSEGRSGTATITVVNVPVASVTVTPATTTVYVGATLPLTATTYDAGNNVLPGRPVTWSSATPAVATVSASGVVTGVAAGGPVTITATSGGVSGTASVTVIVVPVASVQVSPATTSVSVGATTPLSATPRDSNGNSLTGRTISWASGNTGIATVNGSGVVTGVAAGGPVTITATSGGVSGTGSVTVTTPPPTLVRVLLTPDAATIDAGTTQQFAVQGKMSDSSVQAISVTFTAAGGTITQAGLYTAGSTAGTFNVIATAQGQSLTDTSRVTVVVPPPAPVATVTVSPATANVAVGATLPLTATTRDAGNNVLTGRVVTWSSATPAIAAVNASGVVSGVALGGPVTITATSEGQTGTAAITVVIVPVATVQVSPATASVQVGATATLSATPRDSNGNALTGRVITWASGNTGVATVSASGVVAGVAAGGPVTITATSEGKSGTASVTVTSPPATLVRVILLPDTATVLTGGTKQFNASGKMSDSSLQLVSVTFAATGGTVTQGGLYGAGTSTGIFNVIATAQGQTLADTSRVTVVSSPPPGTYTTVIGDDWQSYANSAALIATNMFGANDGRFTVANNLAIVADAVFGQVARITQPRDTNTQVNSGWTVQLFKNYPTPLDKVWYRLRVRWSPGWTTVGPLPSGAANSYKLAFITWVQLSQRAEIEFSNGAQYIIGFGFSGVSCSSTILPGSVSFGSASTEWTAGEWWEYIMYYEKLSATSARARYWKRQLTSGGVVVNNAFAFQGEEKTNCNATVPQSRGIALGANKNKTTPADQFIYWGPWEVVNGLVYPNPWGVGP